MLNPLSNVDVHHLLSDLLPTETYSCNYLQSIPETITSIVLPNWLCNEVKYDEVDFSQYTNLESLQIGENSFTYTTKFDITGLSNLMSLKIGKNSFTRVKDLPDTGRYYSSRYFGVKNCAKLETIEIEQFSFFDYAGTFELSNLPLLNTLKIGSLDDDSGNFIMQDFAILGSCTFRVVIYRSSQSQIRYLG